MASTADRHLWSDGAHTWSNESEEKLISNLGGDTRLATSVLGEMRRLLDDVKWVDSELNRLLFLKKPADLYKLGAVVFRDWMAAPLGVHLPYSPYLLRPTLRELLVEKEVNCSNIVGHWRIKNRHRKAGLPYNVDYTELIACVEEYLGAAAEVCKKLYSEDGRYASIYTKLEGEDVCKEAYLYPWEFGEGRHETYSERSQLTDNLALEEDNLAPETDGQDKDEDSASDADSA